MTKRAAFTKTVTRLLGEDESLVLLLGDIGCYSFREAFEKYPTRCINIGIAEQCSVGIAAGLAASGMYPIFSTITSFLLRRAYEFIRVDFCEQNLSGLFVGIGGQREYWKLGPTHMCREEGILASAAGLIPSFPNESDVEPIIELAVSNRELAYISLEEHA